MELLTWFHFSDLELGCLLNLTVLRPLVVRTNLREGERTHLPAALSAT